MTRNTEGARVEENGMDDGGAPNGETANVNIAFYE